jgi:hypothetical protein
MAGGAAAGSHRRSSPVPRRLADLAHGLPQQDSPGRRWSRTLPCHGARLGLPRQDSPGRGRGSTAGCPPEPRPPPSMGTWGGGRRQSWLPRRWSIGPGFVREREGGEKNEAFFSVTSGSAGNFSSPKPLKAGCGWLLQVHYGKAALGCGFSHGRGPLVGLQAFGESHNRRKSNQRHPKAALKAGSFHPT